MAINEAALAEQSLLDMCALVASLTGGRCDRSPLGTVVRAGFPFPSFYSRVSLGPVAPEQTESALKLVREAALMLVSYTRSNVPETLPEQLAALGYVPMVTQTGMLLPLEKQDFRPQPQVVRIRPDRIGDWAETVCRAFDKPDEGPAFAAMAQREDCYFYAFEQNGALLGTTLLYTENGNAGIHEVGVLPEHRRRGVALALMRHALAQAKRDGAAYATLQASALGEPLYRARGFRAVSTLDTWIRPPKN